MAASLPPASCPSTRDRARRAIAPRGLLGAALVLAALLVFHGIGGQPARLAAPRADVPAPGDVLRHRAVSAARLQTTGAITIYVRSNFMTGYVPADASIDVTWTSPDQRRTQRFPGIVRDPAPGAAVSSFVVPFRVSGSVDGAQYEFADPGSRLEIDVGGQGDPIVVDVPDMQVVVDVEADRLFGTVPQGMTAWTSVRTDVAPSSVVVSALPLDVAADGTFAVDLGGTVDLASRHFGDLTVQLTPTLFLVRRWAPSTTTLFLDWQNLHLSGAKHQRYRIELFDDRGARYFAASGRFAAEDDGSGIARSTAYDLMGPGISNDRSSIQSGDRVLVTLEGFAYETIVPSLSLAVDLATQRAHGTAPPGAPVDVQLVHWTALTGPTSQAQSTIANAAGEFAVAASTTPLAAGDRATARVRQGRFTYGLAAVASHLIVDLDDGMVAGGWLPERAASVAWWRGESLLAVRMTSTQPDGALIPIRLPVSDHGGLRAGDVVRVEGVGASARDGGAVAMTVLPFEVRVEGVPPLIRGVAERGPGRQLVALHTYQLESADTPWMRFPEFPLWPSALRVVWLDDGTFTSGYRPIADSGLAEHPEDSWQPSGFVILTDAAGNHMIRRSAAPILSSAIGTRRVCGMTHPSASVHLERTSADGQPRGAWDVVADVEGRFEVALDASGPPLESGERWTGSSRGLAIDWTVPAASWQADWLGRTFQLDIMPGETAWVRMPVTDDCWGRRPAYGTLSDGVGYRHRIAGPDGRLVYDFSFVDLFVTDALAGGIQAQLFDAAGNRMRLAAYTLHATVHLGTDALAVQAGSALDVTAARPDGASAHAIGDDLGRATLHLADSTGQPAHLETGDRLTIEAGGERVELTLPELDFDFSFAAGAVGRAAPGARVEVMLTAHGGRRFTVGVVADPTGRWLVGPGALVDRRGMSLLDVAEVRAEVPIAGRHVAVRTARVTRPAELWQLWLPFAQVPRR